MNKLFGIIGLLLLVVAQNASALEIYSHRGARGLAPENSIPAYQLALDAGVDYVDMDVGMTKDGVLVVTHNFALNPDITRDAKGNWIKKKILIKDLTYAQLEQYDVGRINKNSVYAHYFPGQKGMDHIHIPTLEQVIHYVKSHAKYPVGFQIEIKTHGFHPEWTVSPQRFANAVVSMLEKENIVERTEVQAFDFRVMQAIQRVDPFIKTAYLSDTEITAYLKNPDPTIAKKWSAGYLLKDFNSSLPTLIAAMGGDLWDPQDVEVTQDNVALAHLLGLKVVAWTWPERTGKAVNIPLLKKLIQYGIDGIITDRPDIIKSLISSSHRAA